MVGMHLVIGGSGFFGSSLAEKLINNKHQVRILDISDPPKTLHSDKFEFIRGDIGNFEVVKKACTGVDIVYHTVALLPISRAGVLYRQVNVIGTHNVLEAAIRTGVRKVIHISTSSVYGVPEKIPVNEKSELNPMGEYGKTKLEGELLCLQYLRKGLPVTILRPRAIIGPGRLGIFGILFEWLMNGRHIFTIGSGNNRYQMIGTPDLIDACLCASEKGTGEIFNIGSDMFGTVREELMELARHANTGSRVIQTNEVIVKSALKTLDFFRLSPLVDWHYLGGGKDFVFDSSKAKYLLGWKPKYGDVEMLIAAYDWYVSNYEEIKNQIGTTHRKTPQQRILKLLSYVPFLR